MATGCSSRRARALRLHPLTVRTPTICSPISISRSTMRKRPVGDHFGCTFQPARAKHRRELDTELRRACVNQEFVLYFQPQLRSSDGAVIGAEALLRWHHPERGIVAP